MARAVLITNPVAARSTARNLNQAAAVLRRAGITVEIVTTGAHGDARRIAGEAVAGGIDLVAVHGGDGTSVQAASALVGTDVPLGLLPAGTGNLLAGNLRLPRSPIEAARIIACGGPRRIDLGRVERDNGPVYFAVACGAGIDARVMGRTPSSEKRRWKIGAYIATALRMLPQIRSVPCRITVDGSVTETNAAMVLVANCGEVIPPWLRLGPGISPSDGLLDVLAVRADGVLDGLRAVWQAWRSVPREGGRDSLIGYARGRNITVETQSPEPVEMDGDPDGVTPFTAEVVPGAIAVMTPRNGRTP